MKIDWKELRGTIIWLLTLVFIVVFFSFVYSVRDLQSQVDRIAPIEPINSVISEESVQTEPIEEEKSVEKEDFLPEEEKSVDNLVEEAQVASFEMLLLDDINQYREEKGLSELVWDKFLAESAEMKKEKLKSDRIFAHRLEGEPEDMFMQGIIDAGYPPVQDGYRAMVGENLACGYETPKKTLEAWKLSPSHNQLLLNPGYSDAGIAIGHFEGLGLKNATWDCLVVVLQVGGKSDLRF